MTENETLTGGIVKTADNLLAAYFDIVNEHAINISNSITEYYLENNTAVHDHISHSPLTLTLSGIRGELTYTPSLADVTNQLQAARNNTTNDKAADKLRALNVLLPSASNAMQLARNAVTYATASLERYAGIASSFQNSNTGLADVETTTQTPTQAKLEELYTRLKSFSDNNTALIVETPYKTFDNMYIETLTLTQGDANYVTDIQITLKQLRFVEVQTTAPDEELLAKYNALQRTSEENGGKASGSISDLQVKIYDKMKN